MRARCILAAVALLLAAAPAHADTVLRPGATASGALTTGDSTLQGGEFVDVFAFEGKAGQRVVVTMTSEAFDAYLLIAGPANFREENDDADKDVSDAQLDVRLPADGTYTISATSYEPGETGAYAIAVAEPGAPTVTATSTAPGRIALGDTVRGTLAAGDDTLESGEFVDVWRLAGKAGERYAIRLSSGAFDPYLVVEGPGGLSEENDDDASAGGAGSRLVITMPSDGELAISATSYEPGESGAYTLSVAPDDGAGPVAIVAAPIALGRTVNGRLAAGDSRLNSGEFVDAYTLAGRRGQAIDVRLGATGFDPYLSITGPENFSAFNDDDIEGGGTSSRLVVTLPADGAYTIRATSFEAGETGAYRLSVAQPPRVNAASAAAIAVGQTVQGALASGDALLASGAFVDRFRFRGAPGERVAIDLRSAAFDGFLTLIAPSGAREQNDDAAEGATDARIDTELTEAGDYVIAASSFGRGGGAYDLSLQRGGAATQRAASPGPAIASSGALTSGMTLRGQLASGDATLASGEFFDRYTFEGRRGDTVAVEMTADGLDSYLIVEAPSGKQADNDDAGADTTNAAVRWVLPETGVYSIRATTYAARESGAYALRFLSGAAAETPVTQAARRGKVFAVMVGISDYAGTSSNLAYTADDAMKLAETLRRGNVLSPQSVTLTDAQATPAAVRAAFQRVAQAAGPDDLFLFFYSGHGGQAAQRVGAGGELDLKDETLVLRGGEITDDELAQMFGAVRARVSLLALDACFSGGFARDVVSRPGVMGLFSSEEDMTSAVADKFEAGGYLSHFLRAGLSGAADGDDNRIVTAGEMSAYLRRQFARDAADVEATSQEGQRSYQFLVVERGGVKIDDPVLMLP